MTGRALAAVAVAIVVLGLLAAGLALVFTPAPPAGDPGPCGDRPCIVALGGR